MKNGSWLVNDARKKVARCLTFLLFLPLTLTIVFLYLISHALWTLWTPAMQYSGLQPLLALDLFFLLSSQTCLMLGLRCRLSPILVSFLFAFPSSRVNETWARGFVWIPGYSFSVCWWIFMYRFMPFLHTSIVKRSSSKFRQQVTNLMEHNAARLSDTPY